MTRTRRNASRSSSEDVLLVDRAKLVRLVESMKVRELAQLAGISVEAVASRLVTAGQLAELSGRSHRNPDARHGELASSTRPKAVAGFASTREPELGRLLGRASRREIKEVVDYWVLGRVLAACGRNITHAANRLAVSRRRLRQRWAVVRGPAIGARIATLASSGRATTVPRGPSLAELLARGATLPEIHQAVDRWIVAHALRHEEGNVTWSARSLGISRRMLRKMRDEA